MDFLLCGKGYAYKSLSDLKEENEMIGILAEKAYTKYTLINAPQEKSISLAQVLQNPELLNYQSKKSIENDCKRLTEIEKPHYQPFNYEYYCPITGDVIT